MDVRKLITTKCELMVSPETDIELDENYVYLEFVVGEGVDCFANLEVSQVPELYRFTFDDDGLFMYYRLKVLTKSFLGENCGEKLYYDDVNDKLMLGNTEITTSSQVEHITDNLDNTDYNIQEAIEEPVFSICRLNHCLTELQRKFIFEGCRNGNLQNCKSASTDKFKRDFLFSSMFILRQLIKQQRYEEALRILNSINSCNGLCSDTKSSNKKCSCCR